MKKSNGFASNEMRMSSIKKQVGILQAHIQKLDDLCESVLEEDVNTTILETYDDEGYKIQVERIRRDFESFDDLLLVLYDQMLLVDLQVANVNMEINKPCK